MKMAASLCSRQIRSEYAMKIRHCVWAVGLVCATQAAIVAAGTSRCNFERATASFAGSPQEQARCLLSPVLPFGHVPESDMSRLPDELRVLIGQSTDTDVDAFREYLAWLGENEQSLGGSLDGPLSSNKRGIEASYFLIHDTSLEMNQPFPADLDTSYEINRLDRYANKGKGAHVFVNRMGDTMINKDFSMPGRATKLENQILPRSLSRGLFLHIELVQPRNREPDGITTLLQIQHSVPCNTKCSPCSTWPPVFERDSGSYRPITDLWTMV